MMDNYPSVYVTLDLSLIQGADDRSTHGTAVTDERPAQKEETAAGNRHGMNSVFTLCRHYPHGQRTIECHRTISPWKY